MEIGTLTGKIRIFGKNYDEIFDVTDQNNMKSRAEMTIYLHNRDNPDNNWSMEEIEV